MNDINVGLIIHSAVDRYRYELPELRNVRGLCVHGMGPRYQKLKINLSRTYASYFTRKKHALYMVQTKLFFRI